MLKSCHRRGVPISEMSTAKHEHGKHKEQEPRHGTETLAFCSRASGAKFAEESCAVPASVRELDDWQSSKDDFEL
jgi:hypothetical protein